jgi:hypothetical protein
LGGGRKLDHEAVSFRSHLRTYDRHDGRGRIIQAACGLIRSNSPNPNLVYAGQKRQMLF